GEGEGEECEDTCEPPRVCDPNEECVECLEAEGSPDPGCQDDRPFCRGGLCAICLADDDCRALGTVLCDPASGECVGCQVDADCTAADLGAACLPDGTCAECADSGDCGNRGCDPRTNTCSDAASDSVGRCEPCVSDEDCDGERVCAVARWPPQVGEEIGTYCGWPCVELGSDCWGGGTDCLDTETRGGVQTQVCLPSSSTCEALTDAGETHCDADEDCGVPDLDDAVCSGMTCSVECTTDADCPGAMECFDDVCGGD
ncbi:MAG: hypothetical protein HYY06_20475, partial [Deltaproteobacteria bacterium]|nr:hypothetical protein [Deltaproteobacteria bacterium]